MAARRHRTEEPEEHVNHERWLISYADMITLLMVLFVVLFAIGQTDLAKFQQLKTGLQSSLGGKGGNPVLTGGAGALTGSVHAGTPTVLDNAAFIALAQQKAQQAAAQAEDKTLGQAEQQIKGALAANGLGAAVKFSLESRGLVVTIVTDQVLYDIDSAVLRSEGQKILDAIGPAIRSLPNDIVIEGHTDDQPVTGGPYPSNWELSTARATAVLHYLIDGLHFDPAKLSAAGYGSERPLVPNTSDANRALNRRVELVVVSTTATPPQSGGPS